MNKLLLVLIALSAGAGVVHTVRQSTTRLAQEAKVLQDDWLVHSQTVASAQTDLAGVNERIKELKQSLRQPPPATDTALWFALQTNRPDRLTTELRERLREELGFNWQYSPDYIVVSKQTVWETAMYIIRNGQLTDVAATVLAVTPEERGQVEAGIQRVKTDFKDWVSAHVARSEPKDDVVAQYSLPAAPEIVEINSTNFFSMVAAALGKERAELILPSAREWMRGIGLDGNPAKLVVKHGLAGDEQSLKVQILYPSGNIVSGSLAQNLRSFPAAFRPLFPNGWADVAKREGFELPEDPPKK